MEINITDSRLTHAVHFNPDGSLHLPTAGGGIALPELATTRERYIVFTLTVLEAHSMPFELRLYSDGTAAPRFTLRLGVMPNFPALICIDTEWFDGHILFPGHTPGELKVVCHGSRISRSEIQRAEFVSCSCDHGVDARIDGLRLSDARPAEYPLPDVKLIDELGQYKLKTWPDKAASIADMAARLHEAARLPDAYPFANWTRYGGCASMKLAEGTGFFSRLKRDGRWYLVDPDGCAFFSAGPNCVTLHPDARVDGIEKLCDWLPAPADPEFGAMYGAPAHNWGEIERGEAHMFSFEQANLQRAFGVDWRAHWAPLMLNQLKHGGMNTIANWSDAELFDLHSMPYVTSLERFPETELKIFRDFPDVFSAEYAANAETCAQTLAVRRDDPWMIGYFLRNEPSWAFVDNLVIADEVLFNPESSACKYELINWLSEQYGDIAAFNAAWESHFGSFDELRTPVANASQFSARANADMHEFSRRMLEAYVAIPAQACRAVDSKHMNLGMRWAWISDPDVVSGWRHFDVFSINCYAMDPTPALENVRSLGVDLPIMIGEFHHGALDTGLTATGLEAVHTQAERGLAYRYYCERVAAHPNGVGCHYFQCKDQFALGRFDGENYNIGLFDICLHPNADMIDAVRECARSIYCVMAGTLEPRGDEPVSIPMIAY